MTGYFFRIKGAHARAEFVVIAETPAEAVRTVNDELRKTGFRLAGNQLFAPDFADGGWVIELTEKVTEAQIAGIAFAPPDDFLRGCRTLTTAGYVYAGDPRYLETDGKPLFTKKLRGDGDGGIHGDRLVMRVRAEFAPGSDVFDFQIGAELIFPAASEFGDDETPYVLSLRDERECISAVELAQALELYERKFIEIAKVLLNADLD